jgi:hypothetical protein
MVFTRASIRICAPALTRACVAWAGGSAAATTTKATIIEVSDSDRYKEVCVMFSLLAFLFYTLAEGFDSLFDGLFSDHLEGSLAQ